MSKMLAPHPRNSTAQAKDLEAFIHHFNKSLNAYHMPAAVFEAQE